MMAQRPSPVPVWCERPAWENGPVPGRLNDKALAAIVSASNDMIVVFDGGGEIVFVNNAIEQVLGGAPESYLGTNILDYVAPGDVERALTTLELSARFGSVPGVAYFDIRRPDGSYDSLELTTGEGINDAGTELRFLLARRAETRVALESILRRLMEGADLARVMSSVCDVFEWPALGAGVAVAWREPDGRDRHVTTGLPDELSGARPLAPWAGARERLERAVALDFAALPGEVAAEASKLGFGGYWIEPIASPGAPAVVTLWTQAGEVPPALHSQGMELARELVGVILGWADQQYRLDFAATHDTLTGLANRSAFYEALARTVGGAVLYGDLDGFKPVNDRFGHAAGDAVLRIVGERLRGTLHHDDAVARLGGDEFAVICPGADAAQAARLADAIQQSVGAPIEVGGSSVRVRISIGTALEAGQLGEATLDAADRDLYRQKLAALEAERSVG